MEQSTEFTHSAQMKAAECIAADIEDKLMDDDVYKASFAYFENRNCRYYPCHKSEHINCLFCYCPLYRLPDCPGEYTITDTPEGRIKNCTDCLFPHEACNYGRIINELRKHKYCDFSD